jgi:DNA modification methylase
MVTTAMVAAKTYKVVRRTEEIRSIMKEWLNQIHQGDCLKLMRELPDKCVDLVLTDPPYPGLKGGTVHMHGGITKIKHDSVTIGDPWQANLEWVAEAWRITKLGLISFCSYHFVAELKASLPDTAKPVGLLTWYQRNAPPSVANVPRYCTEYIWLFQKSPGLKWRSLKTTMFDIPMLQAGCMANERILGQDGKAAHPNQKPARLIRHLLSIGGDSVLDPFSGSGTIPMVVAQLGRQWIGFEINPEYVKMARERIERETAQLSMFNPVPSRLTQACSGTQKAASAACPSLAKWGLSAPTMIESGAARESKR